MRRQSGLPRRPIWVRDEGKAEKKGKNHDKASNVSLEGVILLVPWWFRVEGWWQVAQVQELVTVGC